MKTSSNSYMHLNKLEAYRIQTHPKQGSLEYNTLMRYILHTALLGVC